MLYLMMDSNATQKIVKIGYSAKPTERRSAYKGLNPLAIMRSISAGTKEDETRARKALSLLSNVKRIKGTEWFIVPNGLFEKLYSDGLAIFVRKSQNPRLTEETF